MDDGKTLGPLFFFGFGVGDEEGRPDIEHQSKVKLQVAALTFRVLFEKLHGSFGFRCFPSLAAIFSPSPFLGLVTLRADLMLLAVWGVGFRGREVFVLFFGGLSAPTSSGVCFEVRYGWVASLGMCSGLRLWRYALKVPWGMAHML